MARWDSKLLGRAYLWQGCNAIQCKPACPTTVCGIQCALLLNTIIASRSNTLQASCTVDRSSSLSRAGKECC